MQSGRMQAHALRLQPGEELVAALQDAARQALGGGGGDSQSCVVLTAVGSVSNITLRMANASFRDENVTTDENCIRTWNERMEVVSLVGTLTAHNTKHLHMSLSNENGEMIGGHLVAGTIYTTLELVLGTIEGVSFDRRLDERTGYRELVVEPMAKAEKSQDGGGGFE